MKPRYLFPKDFMADPSANVFNDRVYIYPSHDWDAGECFDDDGGHFQMLDYHVLSLDDVMNGAVTDHGEVLHVNQVAWAEKQMWDNDVVEKDGKYYLVFSAKDYNGVFHLGVAFSERPEGPFVPAPQPIRGSFSIDPCVFKDDDGEVYCYFGGLWGGQLQWYAAPESLPVMGEPHDDLVTIGPPQYGRKNGEMLIPASCPALPSYAARMNDDMSQFAEAPRPVVILDENGEPMKAGDPHRFWRPTQILRSIMDAQVSRQILLLVLHWRQPSVVLCHRRQPLRTIPLSGSHPRACHRLDHTPLHRGVQRSVVSLPS